MKKYIIFGLLTLGIFGTGVSFAQDKAAKKEVKKEKKVTKGKPRKTDKKEGKVEKKESKSK